MSSLSWEYLDNLSQYYLIQKFGCARTCETFKAKGLNVQEIVVRHPNEGNETREYTYLNSTRM